MAYSNEIRVNRLGGLKAVTVISCLLMFSLVSPAQASGSQKPASTKIAETSTVSRSSKVTAKTIVETSTEVKTRTETSSAKNSTTSKSTSGGGIKTLKSTADTKITQSVKTTKQRTKTANITITETTTRKTQTFQKATSKKGVEFTFAMGSPGISGVLLREALERVNFKSGSRGTFQEIANSDLVVAGAASGQFQMGSSTTSAVMRVIQNGANLRFIGESSRNQWTLVAKNPLKTCADINGKRLALHSAGGVSTALYRAWAKRNCGTNKPSEQFIAGSPNRLIALLADRIDVTMMEVEDTLSLPAGYSIISNFSVDLPNVKTGLIYVNGDFLKQNPNLIEDFVYETTRLAAELNSNAKAFKALVAKWEPSYANVDAIVAAYQKAKLFPEDPGSFFKDLEASAEFYSVAGLRARDMGSLSPLNGALQRLEVSK